MKLCCGASSRLDQLPSALHGNGFMKLNESLDIICIYTHCLQNNRSKIIRVPDSKVHEANMGPIWGRHDQGRPHVGPMNFAIWGHHITGDDYVRRVDPCLSCGRMSVKCALLWRNYSKCKYNIIYILCIHMYIIFLHKASACNCSCLLFF